MHPSIDNEDCLLDPIEFLTEDISAISAPMDSLSPVTSDHDVVQQTSKSRSKRPQRVQLQLLRNEVAQLEAIHDVLNQRGQELTEHSEKSGLNEDKYWRQVAEEQFRLLEQAMRDNLQLRGDIAAICELDKRVRRQLRHQEAMLEEQLFTNEHHCVLLSSTVTGGPDASRSLVHADLMGVIVRMYHQTKSVIDSLRQELDLTTGHARDIHLNDRKDTLDIVDARIVPFQHQSTANAIWEWLCSDRPIFRNALIERDFGQHGAMKMSFSGEVGSSLQWLRCRWDLVVRRFDEYNRVVFVTSVRVAVDGIDSVDANTSIKHNQWIVISHDPKTASSEIVCRDVSRLADRKDLQKFVETCIQEHYGMMHVFIDSKLIARNRSSWGQGG